jgi:hypothetical protein
MMLEQMEQMMPCIDVDAAGETLLAEQTASDTTTETDSGSENPGIDDDDPTMHIDSLGSADTALWAIVLWEPPKGPTEALVPAAEESAVDPAPQPPTRRELVDVKYAMTRWSFVLGYYLSPTDPFAGSKKSKWSDLMHELEQRWGQDPRFRKHVAKVKATVHSRYGTMATKWSSQNKREIDKQAEKLTQLGNTVEELEAKSQNMANHVNGTMAIAMKIAQTAGLDPEQFPVSSVRPNPWPAGEGCVQMPGEPYAQHIEDLGDPRLD